MSWYDFGFNEHREIILQEALISYELRDSLNQNVKFIKESSSK